MATGINNLPYPGKVYSPFDILTAEELNEDVANIESLATGAGIGDAAIGASKIDWATSPLSYATTERDTGATWIDGKPIYKKNLVVTSGFSDYVTVAHGVSGGISMLIPGISAVAVTRSSGAIQTDTPGRSIQVSGANIGFNIDAGTGPTTTRADVIVYYTKV